MFFFHYRVDVYWKTRASFVFFMLAHVDLHWICIVTSFYNDVYDMLSMNCTAIGMSMLEDQNEGIIAQLKW